MSSDSVKKVFIVDDDNMFTAMLADHLGKNHMLRLFHFSTGEACLNEMYQGPDFIVLDYNLDSVEQNAADGMAILEKIKKVAPRVHVIMLSSQTHYGKAAQTIMKGAEQYVIKDENAFKSIADIIDDIMKRQQ